MTARLAAIFNRSADIAAYLSFTAVLLMVAHVTADVCLRVVANAPLIGTTTFVSYYYMVAIAFLPLGDIERRDGHISVDVIFGKLGRRGQTCVLRAANIIALTVYLLLTVKTLEAAIDNIGSYQNDGSSRIYTWPTYFFPPLGFIIIAIVLVMRVVSPQPAEAPSNGVERP